MLIRLDGLGYIFRYFRTPPDIYNKHPKIDKYSVFTILAGTYVSSFFGCPSPPSYICKPIYNKNIGATMFFHGGYPPVIKRRNETSPVNGDVYGKKHL